MTTPHVTAVCVTGKTRRHIEYWLPRAQECFIQQTYPVERCHLHLVVSCGKEDVAWMARAHNMSSLTLAPGSGKSLGDLRNLGLSRVRIASFYYDNNTMGLQWDDDDWCHRDRIAAQVAASQNGTMAVTLQRQIRYDVDTDCAYVYNGYTRWGIHGTILHPATKHRYPDKAKGEDTDFLMHWRDRLVVLDNDPRLYVRFSHGDSTSGRQHVMGQLADKEGEWHLNRECAEYLREVLAQYDIKPKGRQ